MSKGGHSCACAGLRTSVRQFSWLDRNFCPSFGSVKGFLSGVVGTIGWRIVVQYQIYGPNLSAMRPKTGSNDWQEFTPSQMVIGMNCAVQSLLPVQNVGESGGGFPPSVSLTSQDNSPSRYCLLARNRRFWSSPLLRVLAQSHQDMPVRQS